MYLKFITIHIFHLLTCRFLCTLRTEQLGVCVHAEKLKCPKHAIRLNNIYIFEFWILSASYMNLLFLMLSYIYMD